MGTANHRLGQKSESSRRGPTFIEPPTFIEVYGIGTPASRHPGIRKSKNRKTGNPEIRKSGNQEIRNPEIRNPEIRKSIAGNKLGPEKNRDPIYVHECRRGPRMSAASAKSRPFFSYFFPFYLKSIIIYFLSYMALERLKIYDSNDTFLN